jgi:ligand-binding SRPBCC domain-containing protein
VTAVPAALHPGVIIDYRLRLHGFPLRWQSEITVWEPPWRFIDEQRRGPYRLWVHEHRFAARDGGTDVIDHVRYVPRGGWLLDWLFVRRDLDRVFRYRREKLGVLFGQP